MLKLLGREPKRMLPPNATFEERVAYIKEMADEADREDIENAHRKKLQTPERERIEYPYWDVLHMRKEDVPPFMVAVFITPFISTDEKDKFARDFCRSYFDNIDYKESVEGKFLYFENDVIHSILDNIHEMPQHDTYVSKLIVPIGKLQSHNGYAKVSQELNFRTTTYDLTDQRNTYHGERLSDTMIVIRPISFIFGCTMNVTESIDFSMIKNKIIDTGLEITPLFDTSFWDFRNGRFLSESLRNYEAARVTDILQTCNGAKYEYIIFLKRPFFVSIGGLPPVKIFSFTVSINETTESISLIGMDIISQYSLIMSKFDGKYGMKIMELREEF
jgi:hypothetical protein